MKQSVYPIKITALSGQELSVFARGRALSTLDKCGMFFCRSGEVEMEIDDTPYIIRKGDVYFYTPSALVRLKRRSADLKGVLLEVDLDYILPLSHKVLTFEDILYLRDHPCVTLTDAQCRHLSFMLETYDLRTRSEDFGAAGRQMLFLQNELVKSFGQLLFCELMTIYYARKTMQPVSRSRKDLIFQHFLLTLFRSYRRERDVAFYAREQNLSVRYFSSIIKEKSGRNALQWIVRVVISEARQLLESSDASIKEIAVQLNFSTQSFFGKYFKQYVGISPAEYRRQFLLSQQGQNAPNGQQR